MNCVGRDGEGHTSLWCAVREQKYDMVNYLISRGAKVSPHRQGAKRASSRVLALRGGLK
jgi:ankyrin repeat protein